MIRANRLLLWIALLIAIFVGSIAGISDFTALAYFAGLTAGVVLMLLVEDIGIRHRARK